MKAIGIIPSRYASTRFPGKPLALIGNKPMIQWVYERCKACPGLSRVIVATDHDGIASAVASFGGEVVMTSPDHRSGTERCAEVMRKISSGSDAVSYDAVVNVQGDEPYGDPAQIEEVIREFRDSGTRIVTLAKRLGTELELRDPNVVKVVFDASRKALYFSRSTIPFLRNRPPSDWLKQGTFYKHIGIYGYRPDTLAELVTLGPSPLEEAESLEQLRWLEAGYLVTVRVTEYESVAIDTPSDLLKITNREEGNGG